MNAIIKTPLVGEILEPGDTFRVTAAMHPFKAEPTQFDFPVGMSLDEVVNECAARCDMPKLVHGATVEINGQDIDIRLWKRVRAKRGMHVFVRGTVKGNFFKTILMVALVVLAAFIGGPFGITTLGLGYAGAAIASTAILIGGTLLLNALFPPSVQKSTRDQQYSIGASRNEASPWGPVPVVFGKIRAALKYAASPFTEFVGDDQFIRNLYAIGIGPLDLSDPKIGDTPFSEFEDIEAQFAAGKSYDTPQTLYPNQAVQNDYQIDVTKKDSPIVRVTPEDAIEIQFDLLAPNGVVDISPKSGKKKRQELVGTATLTNETGGGVVATIPWDMSDNDTNPKRKTFSFSNLPGNGRYKLNINRTTRDYDDSDNDESDNVDNITLTAIRAFRAGKAINFPRPLATLALRIRATQQLSGNPDEVNMMMQALGPVWDGSKWVQDQPTQNCASMALLALMGNGIVQQKTLGEIDNNSWVRFYLYCELYGFKFDMYRDFASSVYDTVADILAAGRGVRVDIDGRIGVSFEDPDEPVKQHFTPRNSSDFKMRITYQEMPHGLRCKFLNETKDYKEDEKLVFFDGYDKNTATLYVEVEFPGVTHPDLIYRHARYRIAEMLLRGTTYSLTADYEHMVLNRGSRARISHDILNEEVVAARVVKLENISGGARVTIDQNITQKSGVSYGVRCRGKDGTQRLYAIQNTANTTNVFFAPNAAAQAYQPGDLVVFGVMGSIDAIYRVLKVRKQTDLRATIDFVDDAPGIMGADTGPVPPGPGEVETPPPLALYRPYGLAVAQFIDPINGVNAQITRLTWAMKPGGPLMEHYLAVAIDADGKQYQVITPNGSALYADFLNLPSSNYTILVQGFTQDGRYTGYSDPFYLSQLFPDDKVGVDLTNLTKELLDAFTKFEDESNEQLEEIRQDLQARLQALLDEQVGNKIATETSARQEGDTYLASRIDTVQSVSDNAAAQVREEARTRANADSAQASDIRTALAASQSAQAAVKTESEARASQDNALAQQYSAVLAQTNQASASGYYWLQAIGNGPNGHAQFSVNLNAGTPQNPKWARSGFLMEAWVENGVARSRILMTAQTFAISNGNGSDVVPFIVSNNQVFIDTAFIRNLNVNNIAINGVQFENILDGATSNSVVLSGGSSYLGTYLEVKGGRVAVWIRAVGSGSSASAYGLYRNGSRIGGVAAPVDIITVYRTDGSGRSDRYAVYGFASNMFGDSPGTGTFLYELKLESGPGGRDMAMVLLNSRK